MSAGGFDFFPADREQYEGSLAIARSELDEVDFDTAKAKGEAIVLREAIAYALGF
jgi:hypothetical protein